MISSPTRQIEWAIPSVLAEVRPTADRALHFLSELKLGESDLFDLRLCFEEALINAVKYGNRENREIPVKIELGYNDSEIFIAVEDRGPGFDPSALKDPTNGTNLERQSGRGVFLIKNLMNHVRYNAKGNRIEMTKLYKKPARVKEGR